MTQKVVEILDAAQNMNVVLITSKLQQIVVKVCSSTTCSLSLSNTIASLLLIILCGPPSSRSPQWRGGGVARTPLRLSRLLDPHTLYINIYIVFSF